MKRFALLVGLTMFLAACSESSPADLIDVEPSFAKAASKAVVNSARGSGNIRDTPGRVVTFSRNLGHAKDRVGPAEFIGH